MHLLAANWGWFLVAAVVFALVAVVLQVRNIRAFMRSAVVQTANTLINSPTVTVGGVDDVFKRFIPVIVFSIVAAVSFLLTVVGVIANFMGK